MVVMGYSVKENREMEAGGKVGEAQGCDNRSKTQHCIDLSSSPHASDGAGGDVDHQRISHGFIKPSDSKSKDQVVSEKLKPSYSDTSITSIDVVSNDACKLRNQLTKPASRVGLTESLVEIEGRQETSPHPPRIASSCSAKELQRSSSSTNNRQKASPLPEHFDHKQMPIHDRHLRPDPPTIGFRPSQHSGFHSAPQSYQQHYDPHYRHPHHTHYARAPPPGRHYYAHPMPQIQRYPTHRPMPTSSEMSDVESKIFGNREGSRAPTTASSEKRSESLPLKKRKMIDLTEESDESIGTIKTISVDDLEKTNKASQLSDDGSHDEPTIGEHHRREDYHGRYHSPRYSCPPYQPPYHHSYGHYYSSYYPSESAYYPASPSSDRHHPNFESYERPHSTIRHQHRKSVSPIDEACASNTKANKKQVKSKKQEDSSRMDKLATAADSLQIKSETVVKSEETYEVDASDKDESNRKVGSHEKCIPISNSELSKYLDNKETAESLPAFAEIVNYPQFLPEKGSPTKKYLPPKIPSEKPCVMCGITCTFAGSTPSRLHAQSKESVIPKQNKGLCNSCDGKTWIFSESKVPIKWCKGCKNFRLLQAFGDKHRATKCVRCRKRQRDNYAELKRKRESQYEGANLLMQQKSGWGSASEESEKGSERGSPELDAALGLASLIC